jgi:hypothetical protein
MAGNSTNHQCSPLSLLDLLLLGHLRVKDHLDSLHHLVWRMHRVHQARHHRCPRGHPRHEATRTCLHHQISKVSMDHLLVVTPLMDPEGEAGVRDVEAVEEEVVVEEVAEEAAEEVEDASARKTEASSDTARRHDWW